MEKTRLIDILRKKKILKYGRFKLRNGLYSRYYCDIKEAIGNVAILDDITDKLTSIVPDDTTCIAGSGYGGIALASIVSYKSKLPLVLVRDKKKDHGTKKMIEGYLPTKNDRVCIIDDVFTTGSSVKDTKRRLSSSKCKFVEPAVVLNRSKKVVLSILKDRDLLK